MSDYKKNIIFLNEKRKSIDNSEIAEIKQTNLEQKKELLKNKEETKVSNIPLEADSNKNDFVEKKENTKINISNYIPSSSTPNLSKPGIIGLTNIGATCYMNATLQCFSNITRLRSELLKANVYNDLQNNKNTKNPKSIYARLGGGRLPEVSGETILPQNAEKA